MFIAQKKFGFILPADMTRWDYLLSCARNHREHQQILRKKEEYESNLMNRKAYLPNLQRYTLARMMVISHTSTFSGFLRIFDIICCLVSSYVYCWFIAFTVSHAETEFTEFQILMETVFFFIMVSKFLTDFIPDGEVEPTKDLTIIAKNYLKNGFLIDLIPIIPASFLVSSKVNKRLAFIIKLVRIISGLKLFDVRKLNKIVKNQQKQKIEKISKNNDNDLDKLSPYKFSEDLMLATNTIKILKLVFIIMNCSYFIGLFWITFCEIFQDIKVQELR